MTALSPSYLAIMGGLLLSGVLLFVSVFIPSYRVRGVLEFAAFAIFVLSLTAGVM